MGWTQYDPIKGDYLDPKSFKIGSIVSPFYRGSLPTEVIGHEGVFVRCRSESGTETLLFPSEIGEILIEETRNNLIKKII